MRDEKKIREDRLRHYRLCTTLIEKPASDDVQESLQGAVRFICKSSLFRQEARTPPFREHKICWVFFLCV